MKFMYIKFLFPNNKVAQIQHETKTATVYQSSENWLSLKVAFIVNIYEESERSLFVN